MASVVSTIDHHPQLKSILKAKAMGDSNRKIARDFGLGRAAVDRYMRTVPAQATRVAEEAFREGGQAMSEIVLESMHVIRKVVAELDTRLTDPNDHSRYWLGPNSDEVEILYTEYDSKGNPKQKRAPLQELIENLGVQCTDFRWKREDPRKLLMGAADLMGKQAERFEKIAGDINESHRRETQALEFDALMGEIVQILEKFPEAHKEVVSAIHKRRDAIRVLGESRPG